MKTRRLTAYQAELFKTRTEQAFAEFPHLKKLHDQLLSLGGVAVVLWNGSNDERTTQALISSGKAEPGGTAILKLGKRSQCHENSEKMHRKDPERYAVCTGYALSDDGIWRPHSWAHDGEKNRIIETTEKRAIYFGLVEVDRRAPGKIEAGANEFTDRSY